jgi:hypothetical protein
MHVCRSQSSNLASIDSRRDEAVGRMEDLIKRPIVHQNLRQAPILPDNRPWGETAVRGGATGTTVVGSRLPGAVDPGSAADPVHSRALDPPPSPDPPPKIRS